MKEIESGSDLLNDPGYARAVEQADKLLQRRSAVVSGHRITPKMVWTLNPMGYDEIKALVSAGGASPLVAHEVMTLPRYCITWTGAPHWAQYAYLVMVEVWAEFGETQR